ncbi:MAG: hypothetical protein KBD76_08215 [Bacteriovorax sp.]|nr:hypothetical protein [Bacteriovorax sp.]
MSETNQKTTNTLIGQTLSMKAEDIEEIEARLKEAKEITAEFIRKNPLTSVALAAGLGYFVAKFFYKKR